jgi:hypothetical protein
MHTEFLCENLLDKEHLDDAGDGGITFRDISEMSDSRGSEYDDGCLLIYCSVQYSRRLPTFQRCLLAPSSGQ